MPSLVVAAEAVDEDVLYKYYRILRKGLVDSGLVQSDWDNDP